MLVVVVLGFMMLDMYLSGENNNLFKFLLSSISLA